jgi:hypothetical protein
MFGVADWAELERDRGAVWATPVGWTVVNLEIRNIQGVPVRHSGASKLLTPYP